MGSAYKQSGMHHKRMQSILGHFIAVVTLIKGASVGSKIFCFFFIEVTHPGRRANVVLGALPRYSLTKSGYEYMHQYFREKIYFGCVISISWDTFCVGPL